MIRRPPRSTRTDTLFPYTTLFRSTTILRMMLARMIPGVIAGRGSLVSLASAPIDFAKLDRAGSPLRIRVDSTAIQIVHEGDPASAEHVLVTYADRKSTRLNSSH